MAQILAHSIQDLDGSMGIKRGMEIELCRFKENHSLQHRKVSTPSKSIHENSSRRGAYFWIKCTIVKKLVCIGSWCRIKHLFHPRRKKQKVLRSRKIALQWCLVQMCKFPLLFIHKSLNHAAFKLLTRMIFHSTIMSKRAHEWIPPFSHLVPW